MSLDLLLTLDTIEVLENYIDRIRPTEELRDRVDIGYKIENQSIILYELRLSFYDPEQKFELAIAKATFIKARNSWKVFWQRSDLKWHSYTPYPIVRTVKEFVALVEADEHGCFWG